MSKGYTQVQDVDFEDSFPPIARIEIMRLFLALVAHKQWPIYHLDVKFAFLNDEKQEEVFVDSQKVSIVQGNEHKVYRLKKAL